MLISSEFDFSDSVKGHRISISNPPLPELQFCDECFNAVCMNDDVVIMTLQFPVELRDSKMSAKYAK